MSDGKVVSRVSAVYFEAGEKRQVFALRDYPLSVWLHATEEEASDRVRISEQFELSSSFRP